MLIWITIGVIWFIDRVLKVLIQGNFTLGESMVVIPDFFHLTYVLNPGAAFGLLPGRTWIFIPTAIIVCIGIIYAQFKIPRQEWLMRLTLGLIGGGALGNLYDRLFIGKVVDYLDFQIWPFVFNFADSAIVVGVGLLMMKMFLEERKVRKTE
ncbi:MAG TPA: signal peptidase II [Desulfitobacterium dehalogenans]|uniref:Lipoprotein signal peptidase n=1 Tax=Desulfitobacterium dehalogenans TaxID=36854 RepID=A0A7C7D7H4_9FIRM|nr:signal peptidase II [Desulfitobacterium dehalogenans]